MPAPSKPERFPWPPKGPTTGEAPRWQPVQPRVVPDTARGDSLDLAVPPPPTRWMLQVESVWFGLARAPLSARAAATGWSPDPPSAYCGRCGTSVGMYESDATGCPVCRGVEVLWDRFVRVGPYEGLVREAVHELKFTAWRTIGLELGTLLGQAVAETVSALPEPPARVVLVPVPTTWWRRLARGVDHGLTICRGVREVTGWPIAGVLGRRWRPTQVGLAVSKRRTNVRGAFYGRSRVQVDWQAGDLAIVVDDVRTTGATLTEACRVVRALTAEVPGVAVWAAAAGVTGEGSNRPVRLQVGGD